MPHIGIHPFATGNILISMAYGVGPGVLTAKKRGIQNVVFGSCHPAKGWQAIFAPDEAGHIRRAKNVANSDDGLDFLPTVTLRYTTG